METLVATVLIVIIFMVASLLLNSLFQNSIKANNRIIDERLTELQYQWIHGDLPNNYQEDWGDWKIEIQLLTGLPPEKWILNSINTETGDNIIKALGNAY